MSDDDENPSSSLPQRIIDYKKTYQDRPARVQIEFADSIKVEENGSFNVWYSKWSLSGSKFNRLKKAAEFRCNVERDAGRTRANQKQPFCIHFAHGRCTRGVNCTFLHRIPMPGDPTETTVDCFGRDKFRNDRDDMGGIGSFERRCRTLYVGNVGLNDHMKEIVTAHFCEWGEIEYVSILPEKGVAFVMYQSILNAEFAKEAMQNQKLESDEVINVRWAVEDPNPGVQKALKRKAQQEVLETIKAQLPIVGEKGTILDYQQANSSSTGGNLTKDPTGRFVRYKEKKLVGKDADVEDGDQGAFYAGDVDQWQAYCEQYYEYYGVYPDASKENGNGTAPAAVGLAQSKKVGNEMYALPATSSTKPSLQPPPAKKRLVADYASSDEDE